MHVSFNPAAALQLNSIAASNIISQDLNLRRVGFENPIYIYIHSLLPNPLHIKLIKSYVVCPKKRRPNIFEGVGFYIENSGGFQVLRVFFTIRCRVPLSSPRSLHGLRLSFVITSKKNEGKNGKKKHISKNN